MSSAGTPCPGCRGDGRVRCGLCLGYQRVHGNQMCGSCSGLGTIACPRCHGNAAPSRLRWDYGRDRRPVRSARSQPRAAISMSTARGLVDCLFLIVALGVCWLCAGRPWPWR
jgi:hypothetical protein